MHITSMPVGSGRRSRPLRALPLVVLTTLLAMLTLLSVLADRAVAYNGSNSSCALQGTIGGRHVGQQTDYIQYQQPGQQIDVGVVYVDFPDAGGAGSVAPCPQRPTGCGTPRTAAPG
jgi:hypothetical protein